MVETTVGRRRSPDPTRLLREGGQVQLEELFRLIHQANPTDRGLPQAEQTQRYALKAALQSLLIERFADRLRVRDEEDDTVLIEHASGDRDACHARLSALSAEAHSWVRWQLDTAEPRAATQSEGRTASGEATVLDQARRALEEYDYPLADGLLVEAFKGSGGQVAEALALLELLVEHLGLDERSLALEPDLSRRAREHPRVRALLALSAARLGRLGAASRLVEGLRGLAEVHAELARQALVQGENDLARSSAGRLRDADPAHPALPALEQELDARRRAERADRRRPAELELLRLQEGERWVELQEQANALLRRFPGSAVAASCRSRADQALTAQETAELELSAEHDAERGDLGGAIEKLGRARALGADVGARLSQLREAEARTRDEGAVEAVRALLPEREGLLAWCALSAELRQAFPEPRLRDLGSLLRVSRRPEPAVDALLALESLTEAMPVEARLALLEPHSGLLERSRGRSLLHTLRTARQEQEAERRRAARAEEASRQAAEEFARFDDAAGRQAWLDARRIARRHDEDPAWKERLGRAARKLSRSWGLRVQSPELLPYPDLRDFRLTSLVRGVNPFLTGPDELLLGNRAGPLIVLRRVGLDGSVRELVELRPPGELTGSVCPEVHGDLVFMHSGRRLIVLRHSPSWEVVDDIDLVELAGTEPKEVVVVDHRYAWLSTGDKTCVVDLVDRRVERTGAPSKQDFELAGWRGGTAVARIDEAAVHLCRRRDPGTVQMRIAVRNARTPTLGPEGELMVLGVSDEQPDGPLELHVASGKLRANRILFGTSRRMPLTLACERGRGLVWTLGCDVRGNREVRAFQMHGLEPRPLWQAAVPRATELVVHRQGLGAALIMLSTQGARVLRLGDRPPALAPDLFPTHPGPPRMGPPFSLAAEADLRGRRREVQTLHPEWLEEGAQFDDSEALGVIMALQGDGEEERASRMLAEQIRRQPGSQPLILLRAAERANQRDWEGALSQVLALSGKGLSRGQRFWKHLLECMCRARLGDLAGAHAAVMETLSVEPDNDGAQAVDAALAALRGVGDRRAYAALNPHVATLVHSLADAAQALRQHRFSDVLRHADNHQTWACWEAGGLYLMCRAWQALCPTDPLEVARARAAAGGLLLELELEGNDHLPLGDLEPGAEAMKELALELLAGLVPDEEPDMELTLEDIALAWQEQASASDTAEAFGCSVVSVYAARRAHGLTLPPPTRTAWVAVLRRCGWTREDAEWLLQNSMTMLSSEGVDRPGPSRV